ncbi:TPA: GspK family T2SS minor pseudopilin variant ExeK [Aeromonas salmonicida]|uniref:GspK family T2SS minor pseudopilin variant ExeK n=1 Tax=Aeromonas salmonicida TaxID=645 RepID=UPI000B589DAC|nr:GspK family T2SS minor pseudopilin variant ExeK [Aeromonas salmonicida]ASI24671.1 type II secretion protein K [Aeromonas salmonicida]ASI28990.1 type II secretion protein K [Aeromonas salmonicida]ASI33120.1 type II secretion protein K [Aeromonas salmonicida]ATD36688.1 type II secretion protein K [Aeromonas salmonicida subsp. masoucida]QOI93535.1 GspK family T2SS minor pseudopilin variant ExeK [Aeromonas salmonicida subsp. masoucida]
MATRGNRGVHAARPARQGGMALLVVLLILSVMVIIASNMSGRLQLELRRTGNLTAGKQAWWYAMSAEALVSKVLTQDFKDDPNVVNLGQNWARQDAVFPVDDGKLTGRVRDLQSCFNLNSLSVPLKDGVSGDDLEKQPYQVKAFRALLKQLEVEDYEAVQLTDAIRDWTDKDTALVSSYGAEDAYYEGLTPPYLTANQWMISTDELRAVRGVSAKLYARLAPYVCALPTDKLVVNINTIKPEQAALLVALYQDKIGLDDAKLVLTSRPQKGWKDKKAMTDQMPVQVSTIIGLDTALDVKSSYFEAKLIAEVGDTRARLESVFVRGKDNKLVMLRRLSGGAE